MKQEECNTCPVAKTAEVIGMRWSLLILRDLFDYKSRRYQDLLESLEGISPNTLSNRLKLLETEAIVERRMYQDNPPRAEYILTDAGRDIGPILKSIRKWGEKHMD
jgi:DNA-binding HxlR family transcriptional regulator